MNPTKFFAELKRRKVYSVAIGYLVAGWALAQGVAQVFPVFDIPNWVVRLIVLLIVLGFPVALLLSWFFDLTRYGIVRTRDLEPARKIDPPSRGYGAASIVPATNPNERSIAVLPFADLSPGKDHDYFSDGIAEEILAALAKIDNLRVAARRSSFWFKGREAEISEIAQKLNVEHVLEGSVRRDGNRVRITAQLIDADAGFTLWSETFEREMQGIFALQDEITRAIVQALKLKLDISGPPASRLGNTEAYDVYLQGLFWSDKATKTRCAGAWSCLSARWKSIRDLPGIGACAAPPSNVAATPGNSSAIVRWSVPTSRPRLGDHALPGHSYLNGVKRARTTVGNVTEARITKLKNALALHVPCRRRERAGRRSGVNEPSDHRRRAGTPEGCERATRRGLVRTCSGKLPQPTTDRRSPRT